MIKEVYSIDEDGFIIERYEVEFDDEGNPINDLPEGNIITTALPQPNFHHSKWTGEEWIEGATQDEIDEITKPSPPSEFDKIRLEQAQANAELVELIFGMMGGGL